MKTGRHKTGAKKGGAARWSLLFAALFAVAFFSAPARPLHMTEALAQVPPPIPGVPTDDLYIDTVLKPKYAALGIPNSDALIDRLRPSLLTQDQGGSDALLGRFFDDTGGLTLAEALDFADTTNNSVLNPPAVPGVPLDNAQIDALAGQLSPPYSAAEAGQIIDALRPALDNMDAGQAQRLIDAFLDASQGMDFDDALALAENLGSTLDTDNPPEPPPDDTDPPDTGSGPPVPGDTDYECDDEGDTETTPSLCDAQHVDDLDGYMLGYWIPAYQNMTYQLSVLMMHQISLVGYLLDAKEQLEAQRLFRQLAAEAHRDYQPDTLMCRFGTNIRSLATTEAKAKANTRLLNKALMDREVLAANGSSSVGMEHDFQDRLRQFKGTYCDVNDSNQYLGGLCDTGGAANRVNRDVNYATTIENNYTLDVDFTDAVTTIDEQDIMSLAKNLFSFGTFTKIPEKHLVEEFAGDDYQNTRTLNAIRSVARNSFSSLVGMRATGTGTVGPFMRHMIAEMGVPDGEIDQFLGENPSYFAQMEVLTRKMYQNPAFYENLYTTPANLARVGVTLQAVALMQNRDRYEAALRREMLTSLILELNIREHQKDITNNVLGGVSKLFANPPP